MAYAILRVKKLKTAGAVQAVGQHNNRVRKTLNANPEQPNRVLIEPPISSAAAPATGASEGAANSSKRSESGPLWDAVQARIAEVDARIRKNGVLACEVFLGASPEFFRPHGGPAGTWDEACLEAWTPATMAWLKREWGEKNVVSAVLHLDETTPHIQAVVVPIDPDSGRMNAARWLNGRKALSEMQDRYAESMQGVGLERGVRGSVAEHTEIREWYGQLQQPVPQVPEPVLEAPGVGAVFTNKAKQEYVEQQAARIQSEQQPAISTLATQARERQVAVTQRREAEATNKRLAKELEAERGARKAREQELRQENAALVAERDVLRRQLDQFRQVPLAEALGWFDPEEVVEAGVRIGKDSQGRERIYGRDQKVIGSNAVDLVKAVHGSETAAEAVAWMQIRQGELAASRLERTAYKTSDQAKDIEQARTAVRNGSGWMGKRYERAHRQVGARKPATWDGVVAIFKRMSFDISRTREAMGFVYRLFDLFYKIQVSDYHPHGKSNTGQPNSPMSEHFLLLERQEDARRQREQEEAARIREIFSHRGPRR